MPFTLKFMPGIVKDADGLILIRYDSGMARQKKLRGGKS